MEGYTVLFAICFFVLSFTTIHVSAGDDAMNDIVDKEVFEKCVKKIGITTEQLAKSMKTLGTTADVSAQKDALCCMKCFAEEMGIVGPKGDIDVNKVKENIPEMIQPKYDGFTKCLEKIEKISTCEDMIQISKCAEKIKKIM